MELLDLESFFKVPSGREDVFQDHALDFKAKRALMKFLRFIAEYEEQGDVWEEHRQRPFPTFLSEQFKVPTILHAPLLALTLSSASSDRTTTEFALPRIARHLRSIGVFGPGFGAVIPKWGGLSELSQVGCRASAVGGGVYVLGKGLVAANKMDPENSENTTSIKLRLKDGELVTTRWLIAEGSRDNAVDYFCKSTSIVSSRLASLFPPIADEAPPPAAAIVVFPSGSLSPPAQPGEKQTPPVYIHIHSSETGECPVGQSILYASTSVGGDKGFELLQLAVRALLSSVEDSPVPTILGSYQYEQHSGSTTASLPSSSDAHILNFPPIPLDLAFDDIVLDRVKEVWQKIMGDGGGEFLVFEDREAYVEYDE